MFRKIFLFLKQMPLMIKSLKKIYRYGGFNTINIASIEYGQIFNGKRILITGGSSGIGFHIAKKCVSHGASVIITGRNQEKLDLAVREIGNQNLKSMQWDISDISVIEEQVNIAEELLNGEIDVLVNNAGILLKGQRFPEIDEEIWDTTYATNSKGLFFLTQYMAKKWIATKTLKNRKILNISSQGGFVGATYPYRMTKWDVAGLTQGLGLSLAPYGIIVNGIAPGIVATNMQKRFVKQKGNSYCPYNPLERIALPEEISELAFFLIGDASNFIVGQTIVCDGGFSLK